MKRSDGTRLTNLDPFVQLIPYMMEKRSESTNYARRTYLTDPIDRYLQEKAEQGHPELSYLHVFIAGCVRVLAERPQMNRFIMNRRYYQRNRIVIAMTIKRSLRDEGEETTVKFEFNGTETIFEIARTIDQVITKAIAEGGSTAEDQLIRRLLALPGFLPHLLIKLLKGLDQFNLLPASILKVSPFHSSLFFTYLKSIKEDFVFHHLYNLGTTGTFMALGAAKMQPVAIGDQVVSRNCVEIGISNDERICDGLYLSRSLKLFDKYMNDPRLLENRPELKGRGAGSDRPSGKAASPLT